jgi:hypothetical protein
MTQELPTVSVNCGANEQCRFDGDDIVLEIIVTNSGARNIGFPLAFVQKRGPIIRLVDRRTKADTYLRSNPADFDLEEQFTEIPPGESVTLEWVITAGEAQTFGRPVDLSAEVTIMAKIGVGGNIIDFKGGDTVQILSGSQ